MRARKSLLAQPKSLLEKWLAVSRHVFWMNVRDEFILVSDRPSQIYRDEEQGLHSVNGPAIAFRDGWELYYLWGIHFEKDLFEKVTKKTLPVKDVLALENVEQRMAALKIYGAESCLENATLIETSPRGNSLYVIKDMFSEPQYALKYKCPSTERVYVSFIPPEIGIEGKADAAMAWKFGLKAPEYDELRIEA